MSKENFETIITFPAFEIDDGERRKRPPVNVLPMAACVEQQGISSVRVIDGESLGLSPEDLAGEILRNRPQIVGISVYTPAYSQAQALLARVKELRPEVLTVLGGKHPTHCYRDVLQDPNVDFVVVGEGEEALPKIVAAKQSHPTTRAMQQSLASEPGIAFRERDYVPLTNRVDLRGLPPINWKVLYPDLEFYLQSEDNFLIESSRGCFGKCTFCLAAGYRKGIAYKPLDVFLEELRFLASKGFQRFFLTDDDAMANYRHIKKILEGVRNENLSLTLETNVRADSFVKCAQQEDFLVLAKAAGLQVIHLGIESGSPEILAYCQKGIELRQVREGVRLATQAGLIVESNFIIGLPPDNERTIRESMDFALELRKFGPHLPHISIFMPYPGTQAYDDAIREGLLDPRVLDFTQLNVHKGAVVPTQFLTKKEVETLYNEFYDRLYSIEFMDNIRGKCPNIFALAKSLVTKRLNS